VVAVDGTPAVSRRQVLTVAAAAAGVLGAGMVAAASPPVTGARSDAADPGAVMVRLRSERSGVLDLFVGTERLLVHDADLAARIAAAARPLI
jgi:hypothetical protein